MPLCSRDCKSLIQCVKCGKQLCKSVAQKSPDTVVQQKCSTVGFYNLEEGKICIQCHVAGTGHYGPSRGQSKTSSR